MRSLIPGLLLGAVISAAHAQENGARLHKLFDDEHAWLMRNHPESATFSGFAGQNDRWTDMSRAAIDLRKHHPDEVLKALTSIDRSKLNAEDQLNYDLFRWEWSVPSKGNDSRGISRRARSSRRRSSQHGSDGAPASPPRHLKDYEDEIARLP